MEEYESYCEKLSIDELREEIFKLTRPDDKSHASNSTFALGTYLLKLQEKSNYSPIFPLELSPIPKNELREWGEQYSKRVLIGQGGLQKFQVDAALSYTSFQNLTKEQWKKISSGEIDNFLLYVEDKKKKGNSEHELPNEYKLLADNYLEEYKTAKSLLFKGLDNYQKKLSGCYIPIIIAIVAIGALIWYFFF
ncbi:hypothetical protein O3Q51_16180 [Cryomorphaceae bacterium 1068]|nr:hypothetical protein [Cryomorphaceae bacterium 1068]